MGSGVDIGRVRDGSVGGACLVSVWEWREGFWRVGREFRVLTLMRIVLGAY
jgi:hypothetical protein